MATEESLNKVERTGIHKLKNGETIKGGGNLCCRAIRKTKAKKTYKRKGGVCRNQ